MKILRDFWARHPKAEGPLREWYAFAARAQWRSTRDIKKDFASASFVGKNRVVFNIGGNSYRLGVVSLLGIGTLYVRFVGTHAKYDKNRRDEGLAMRTLKPIRTNTEHARALREIDKLIAKAPRKSSVAFDRLETLTILVEAYERSHPDHRIDESFDPVEAILFHLDRLGKTPKDLEKTLKCSRSRAWEILQRKRALTLSQIRVLVRELGIPAERLIAEYKVRAA